MDGAIIALDSGAKCSHFVLMAVETVGEGYTTGWSLTVRRAFGKGDTMKRVRECGYTFSAVSGVPGRRNRHQWISSGSPDRVGR
jgi:hypothetical protein